MNALIDKEIRNIYYIRITARASCSIEVEEVVPHLFLRLNYEMGK